MFIFLGEISLSLDPDAWAGRALSLGPHQTYVYISLTYVSHFLLPCRHLWTKLISLYTNTLLNKVEWCLPHLYISQLHFFLHGDHSYVLSCVEYVCLCVCTCIKTCVFGCLLRQEVWRVNSLPHVHSYMPTLPIRRRPLISPHSCAWWQACIHLATSLSRHKSREFYLSL